MVVYTIGDIFSLIVMVMLVLYVILGVIFISIRQGLEVEVELKGLPEKSSNKVLPMALPNSTLVKTYKASGLIKRTKSG